MKNLVVIHANGSEGNDLFMQTAEDMGVDMTVVSWNDVLAYGDRVVHYLDSPDTVVRILNPWEDEKLKQDLFTGNTTYEQFDQFKHLMDNVQSMFPRSYFPISPDSAIAIRDKNEIARLLHANDIRHPQSMQIRDITNLENKVREYGTLFMKPKAGTEGEATGIVKYDGDVLTVNTNYGGDTHKLYRNGKAHGLFEKILEKILQLYRFKSPSRLQSTRKIKDVNCLLLCLKSLKKTKNE